MSVALVITWDDAEPEIIGLAFQTEHDTIWADIAEKCKLDHLGRGLPVFVEPGNVKQLLGEARVLRKELLKLAKNEEEIAYFKRKMDPFLDALCRMEKGDRKWKRACIG